jgi:hypothetical protein
MKAIRLQRIAILRAFEVVSTRLSEDSQKLGLLAPIG